MRKSKQIPAIRNIRLTLAFDGTAYYGWQIQPNVPTIQGEIESHLETIHRRHITLHGAGRTDAGVHARGMTAHFHTGKDLTVAAFQQALNSMLTDDIRVLEAEEMAGDFHARFSAKGKTYSYTIYNDKILLPQKRHYSVQVRKPLDFKKISECLKIIEGTHDFTSFETTGSRNTSDPSGKGAVRTINEAKIVFRKNHFHTFFLTGDGFLRHMVRNIVGTILEVGLGRRSVENFQRVLLARNRSEAGSTAPPQGLCLEQVHY